MELNLLRADDHRAQARKIPIAFRAPEGPLGQPAMIASTRLRRSSISRQTYAPFVRPPTVYLFPAILCHNLLKAPNISTPKLQPPT